MEWSYHRGIFQSGQGIDDDSQLPLSHGSSSLEHDIHAAHLYDQQIVKRSAAP